MLEMMPTNENLIKTYEDDTIGRNEILHYFVDLISAIDENCSIALDGNWGTGKTFFVKQTKMIFDAFNEFAVGHDADYSESIQENFFRYQQEETDKTLPSFVTVYYDAWQNDNDEDPILSIVYEVLNQTNSDFSFKNSEDAIKLFTGIGELVLGRALKNIVEALKNNTDDLSGLKQRRDLKEKIDRFLETVLEEHGDRLVIFIDELDRCKPSFAVNLLERIKHYFNNEKVTFIFSINAIELNKTICTYYGTGFNAHKYLDRFFDLRISLPKPNMKKFYESISFGKGSNNLYYSVAEAVIEKYHFDLREITKYVFAIKTASKKYLDRNVRYASNHSIELSMDFCLNVFVPILIGVKMYDAKLYYDFINGEDSSPLIDIVSDKEFTERVCNMLLSNTEFYVNTPLPAERTGIIEVTVPYKLNELYNLIMKKLPDEFTEICIGRLLVNSKVKSDIEKIVNMLSDLTDFFRN